MRSVRNCLRISRSLIHFFVTSERVFPSVNHISCSVSTFSNLAILGDFLVILPIHFFMLRAYGRLQDAQQRYKVVLMRRPDWTKTTARKSVTIYVLTIYVLLDVRISSPAPCERECFPPVFVGSVTRHNHAHWKFWPPLKKWNIIILLIKRPTEVEVQYFYRMLFNLSINSSKKHYIFISLHLFLET